MSQNSPIEWTHHTFNGWWGCTKISPACDLCYAERDAKRFAAGRVLWGVDAERRTFGDKHWDEPLRWDRAAADNGVPSRVFTASMSDVFDNQAPEGARERLFALIKRTPNLRWLVLTKRIGNARRMLPADWDDGYPNVWLGSTICNQEEADRDVPKLLTTPARVRFLSMEPLLGEVDLTQIKRRERAADGTYYDNALTGFRAHGQGGYHGARLDWVIAGGESGPSARPSHPDWFRTLRDHCALAGVPFLFKQWGEWVSVSEVAGDGAHHTFPDSSTVRRIGKRAAGRLLDGVLHDEFPEAA